MKCPLFSFVRHAAGRLRALGSGTSGGAGIVVALKSTSPRAAFLFLLPCCSWWRSLLGWFYLCSTPPRVACEPANLRKSAYSLVCFLSCFLPFFFSLFPFGFRFPFRFFDVGLFSSCLFLVSIMLSSRF
ncbi:unnamed protein product [Laminaria digitata]